MLDAHLAQTASLISVQRDRDEDEDEVDTEHAPVLHRYGRRVMFQVWRNGTTLGLHSQHAPDTPLSGVRDGFSDATIGGANWRVFSMLRLRIEPEIRASDTTTFNFAYEQRLHYASAPTVGIGVIGILPSELATPFRIEPLVWRVSESAKGAWRHEIDRANAQVHLRRSELTIGRQAIGWGRGVMFTSVDLFAPFSPLKVDREWRSGVDAVRADIKVTDRSSVDLVGAFGNTLDRSAFAARARGYAGTIDLEVVSGRREQDLFGGVTSSAAVGDAEVHGEAAAFRLPGTDHDVVWKAVVGGSYRSRLARASWPTRNITTPGLASNTPRRFRRCSPRRSSSDVSFAATCRFCPGRPSA